MVLDYHLSGLVMQLRNKPIDDKSTNAVLPDIEHELGKCLSDKEMFSKFTLKYRTPILSCTFEIGI